MDDSADSKRQSVFVVAGFIADFEVWFDVERHWRRRLKSDGLDYFRATECNSLRGEFYKLVAKFGPQTARAMANELVADLRLILKSCDLAAYCLMGPMDAYRAVQSTDSGSFVLNKDPYITAHQLLIFNVAKSAAKNGMLPPISFLFDEHTKAKELSEDGRN